MSKQESDENAGIFALLRETSDSFVALAAAHMKSSNVELVADLRTRGTRLAVLLAIVAVAGIGYLLLMIGAGLALSERMPRPLAFVLLGGLHFVVAAIAGVVIALWRRRPPQLRWLIDSLSRSVTTVADAVILPPPSQPKQAEPPHAVS